MENITIGYVDKNCDDLGCNCRVYADMGVNDEIWRNI